MPGCYEPGQSEPEPPLTARDCYQVIYFEVFDLIITGIADRIVQP